MNLTAFHKLTENQFIESKLDIVQLNESDVLFNEQNKIDFVYYLINGGLNINLHNQLMWKAQSQEFVGVSSYFADQSNYSYSVDAFENSTILKIPVSDFKQAIKASNSLNNNIMNLLCKRIKLTLSKGKSLASRKRKLNF